MKARNLETRAEAYVMALRFAGDRALISADHGSRVCFLPEGSPEAQVFRAESGMMPAVYTPMELRRAMENPEMRIIFLPREAIMTRDLLERICLESSLHKMIIWESA